MKEPQKIFFLLLCTISFLGLEVVLSPAVKSQISAPIPISTSSPSGADPFRSTSTLSNNDNIFSIHNVVLAIVTGISILNFVMLISRSKTSVQPESVQPEDVKNLVNFYKSLREKHRELEERLDQGKKELIYQEIQDPRIDRLDQDAEALKQKLDTIQQEITTNNNSSDLHFQIIIDERMKTIDRKLQALDSSSKLQTIESQFLSLQNRFKTIEISIAELQQQMQLFLSRPPQPHSEPAPMIDFDRPVTSNLPPEIQEILSYYNNRYLNLEQESMKVRQNAENYNQRFAGANLPIVLEQQSDYVFLIVNDRYLVPKSGYRVTTTRFNTIKDVFDCDNFYSGAPFKVIEPAIVSPIENDRWQVVKKGQLDFS